MRRDIPRLCKAGWPRESKSREASAERADGAVEHSLRILAGTYEPPRLRRNIKEVERRSHPALQRRGMSSLPLALLHSITNNFVLQRESVINFRYVQYDLG